MKPCLSCALSPRLVLPWESLLQETRRVACSLECSVVSPRQAGYTQVPLLPAVTIGQVVDISESRSCVVGSLGEALWRSIPPPPLSQLLGAWPLSPLVALCLLLLWLSISHKVSKSDSDFKLNVMILSTLNWTHPQASPPLIQWPHTVSPES